LIVIYFWLKAVIVFIVVTYDSVILILYSLKLELEILSGERKGKDYRG